MSTEIPDYFLPLDPEKDHFYSTANEQQIIDRCREPYRIHMGINDVESFNMAFNKCTRLSLFLHNIPKQMSTISIHKVFFNVLTVEDQKTTYLGIQLLPTSSQAILTISREGTEAFRIRDHLILGLQSKEIPFILYQIGCQPVVGAIRNTLIEASRFVQLHQTSLPSPLCHIPPSNATEVLSIHPEAFWPAVIDTTSSAININNVYFITKCEKLNQKIDRLRYIFQQEDIAEADDVFDYGYIKFVTTPEFELGCGSEANVYVGLYQNKEEDEALPVAVKYSKGKKIMANPQEAEFCKHYSGDHIVKYFGSDSFVEGRIRIEVLIQDLGVCSLLDFLEHTKGTLTEVERYRITLSMVNAIADLHQCDPPILHRDINPRNFIVMRDGKVRLTDLGLAVQIRKPNANSVTCNGLITNGQPFEVLENDNHRVGDRYDVFQNFRASTSGDIFMLGCSIAEVYNERAFRSNDSIRGQQAPRLSNTLENQEPWLGHLLKLMLSHEKEKRPKIEEVQKHPFILATPNIKDYLASYLGGRMHRILMGTMGIDSIVQGPHDNEEFRFLEKSLLAIEESMAQAIQPWYRKLPEAVLRNSPIDPEHFNNSFIPIGEIPPRNYPLPRVVAFVHWIQNILIAVVENRALLHSIINAKPDGGKYNFPGNFFVSHPALSWFFTKHWEQACVLMRIYEIKMLEEQMKHDEERRKYEEELRRHEAAVNNIKEELRNAKWLIGF